MERKYSKQSQECEFLLDRLLTIKNKLQELRLQQLMLEKYKAELEAEININSNLLQDFK
jgi:hypothetical protein